ncbi:MAG: VCBS repeat-containing protein [Proteobacteria bacterium]|jgi:hypothetical protein|nr:VCBS repeat-containing protein [Pseudomonadota bacterium]
MHKLRVWLLFTPLLSGVALGEGPLDIELADPVSWASNAVGDLNGDGIDDLLLEQQGDLIWLFGSPTGLVTAQRRSCECEVAIEPTIADFDSDGYGDVAFLAKSEGRSIPRVIRGGPNGLTQTHWDASRPEPQAVASLRVGDLDGNGKADLVLDWWTKERPKEHRLQVYQWKWGQPGQTGADLVLDTDAVQFVIVDVDEDGHGDVLHQHNSKLYGIPFVRPGWSCRSESPPFGPEVEVAAAFHAPMPRNLAANAARLVGASGQRVFVIERGKKRKTCTIEERDASSLGWVTNHQGSEILLMNWHIGSKYYYRVNTETCAQHEWQHQRPVGLKHLVGVGDFDGDGRAEAVFGTRTGGRYGIYIASEDMW